MMFKKIVSMITLITFISLSTSCATANRKKPKTLPMKKLSSFQDKKPEVLSFTKTSGEYVELSEDNPGRIYNNNIVWWDVEYYSEPLSEVKDIEIAFKNRWKGALIGFCIVPIPIGLACAGFVEGYGGGEVDEDEIKGQKIGCFLVVGTALGLVLGAPIGYAIGGRDRLILSTELDSTSTNNKEKP